MLRTVAPYALAHSDGWRDDSTQLDAKPRLPGWSNQIK